jgi:acetyl-CoA synthetase
MRQDADGYLYFIGRNDDIITSAGYRIGPADVENVLIEHPSVAKPPWSVSLTRSGLRS